MLTSPQLNRLTKSELIGLVYQLQNLIVEKDTEIGRYQTQERLERMVEATKAVRKGKK